MLNKCIIFFLFVQNRHVFFLMSWCAWECVCLATSLAGDECALVRMTCSMATLHNHVLGVPGQAYFEWHFQSKFPICSWCEVNHMSNTTNWHFSNVIADEPFPKQQTEIHEPERNHVKRFCEIVYCNSLVHFFLLPYQRSVNCVMWNGVECKVWSAKKTDCWMGNAMCGVYIDCKIFSLKYKI